MIEPVNELSKIAIAGLGILITDVGEKTVNILNTYFNDEDE